LIRQYEVIANVACRDAKGLRVVRFDRTQVKPVFVLSRFRPLGRQRGGEETSVLAREREFQRLDDAAWEFLKDEALPYLSARDRKGRGWEQLISILNQARRGRRV